MAGQHGQIKQRVSTLDGLLNQIDDNGILSVQECPAQDSGLTILGVRELFYRHQKRACIPADPLGQQSFREARYERP